MKAEKAWVRVRVKKPRAYQHMPLTGTRLANLPTGTGKIFILPLRPRPTPKPDTEYLSLPFLREHDLEEQVITMLATVPDYYTQPNFSLIPAIKHAKETMGWDLQTSKYYVEKIYKNNLDKIEAARVISLKSWKGPTE